MYMPDYHCCIGSDILLRFSKAYVGGNSIFLKTLHLSFMFCEFYNANNVYYTTNIYLSLLLIDKLYISKVWILC